MAQLLILAGLAGSCLLFGAGFVAAVVAHRKGYRPWFWLLSAGPFGMLLILLKPRLRQAKTPEERERWEERCDWAGGILSGFTLFFLFGLTTLGFVGFASVRTVSGPAMVRSSIATMTVTVQETTSDTKPDKTPGDSMAVPQNSEKVPSSIDEPIEAEVSR